MTTTREKGLAKFGSMMGDEAQKTFESLTQNADLVGEMAQLAADFAFGSIWARPGLAPSQRSLVTLGVLIAQSHPAEIRNHFRIALANGLTPAELEEAVLQTVPYVGFPAASTATTILIEVLRENGARPSASTPEEYGML
jgi:4-carboxymuconolactone decarboxylase